MKRKLVVVGHATVDATVDESILSVDFSSVVLQKDGRRLVIMVEGGSIAPRGKYYVAQGVSFRNELLEFSPEIGYGGGGINSVLALKHFATNDDELNYADFVKPHLRRPKRMNSPSSQELSETGDEPIHDGLDLDEHLRGRGIQAYFANLIPLPFHLVFPYKDDRVIIRSKRNEIPDNYEAMLKTSLDHATGVLFNSLARQRMAEIVMGANITYKVAAITKSLPVDFVHEKIAPHTVCHYNIDDVPFILGETATIHDPDERRRYADDAVPRLRGMHPHGRALYVTMHDDGAYCAHETEIIHLTFKDRVSSSLSARIRKDPLLTNGSGDNFAAAVFYAYVNGAHAMERGIAGIKHAARYLGYPQYIRPDDIRFRRVA